MARIAGVWMVLISVASASAGDAYRDLVLADKPVAYWTFEKGSLRDVVGGYTPKRFGNVKPTAGPQHDVNARFAKTNKGIRISGGNGSLRLDDPRKNSPFRFAKGDTITVEAWVKPDRIVHGNQVYVIGKGRTARKGFAKDNQNWALRLRGVGAECRVSFLFYAGGKFHRWNSAIGFRPQTGWHHVAVTHTFGKKADPICFIDGRRTIGTWDMGGATTAAPIVDGDQIWIGSTLGGNSNTTFPGAIDEIAVYRNAVAPKHLAQRFTGKRRSGPPELPPMNTPSDRVLVEVFEYVPSVRNWKFPLVSPTERYFTPAFAFLKIPPRYDSKGLIVDRTHPFVIRARTRMTIPAGRYRVLVRARNGSRLFFDNKPVLETPFHNIAGNAHGKIRSVAKLKQDGISPLQTGDNEATAEMTSTGKPIEVRFEAYLGGGNKRPEPGELCVFLQRLDQKSAQPWQVLTQSKALAGNLSADGWLDFRDRYENWYQGFNANRRRTAAKKWTAYWERRHAIARRVIADRKPITLPPGTGHPVDRFLAVRLAKAGKTRNRPIDDYAFARRVSIDVVGTLPRVETIRKFLADKTPNRHARLVNALLADPAWADNWVGYWQDLLAENPNLVNPTLNNTGPFRWWIYESFRDNKPFDRFATELIGMRGSLRYGGPGGFSMASQNDAPMAAKAHIIGQAFLGIEMKCARCHDSPFREVTQRDLFSIAALLNRAPQAVPKGSTVPADITKGGLVKVTLKPGEKVTPKWPFAELSAPKAIRGLVSEDADARERLAAFVTSPHNRRFAMVIVNRLWKRYLGRGLVEPVGDWEGKSSSHPGLLEWLANELIVSGYDLKHIARLILTSETYRAETAEFSGRADESFLFPGPVRRRMTAEQIVDSIFAATGKRMLAGELNIDADGSRNFNQSLNFGRPRRAWQFIGLSNERDRPSLALPLADPFIDTLESFGWRSSRQNPISERDETSTVQQPAILANGILAKRFSRLSEDSTFTRIALRSKTPTELVRKISLQALSRLPSREESKVFVAILTEGFEDRINRNVKPEAIPRYRAKSTGVSWSNHLSPEASRRQIALAEYVAESDPPTPRLKKDWRERMEDVLWAIINSPEFIFLP